MMPFRFAREHVRHVHLHERDLDADKRITNRKARVRVRPGVDDRTLHPASHPVHEIDQCAFTVLLRALDLHAQFERDAR